MGNKADTPQTAIVAVDEFLRMAANVALFASTDDTLPSLTTVHFRPGHTPGTLLAEATNRYVVAQEEIDLADLAVYDSDWDRGQLVKHLADVHGTPPPAGHDGRTEPAIRTEHDARHADGADHEHTVRPMPVTGLDVLISTRDLASLVKTVKMQLDGDTRFLAPRDRPHLRITREEGADRVAFTLFQNAGNEVTVSPRLVTGEFPNPASLFERALLPPGEYLAALQKAESELASITGRTAAEIGPETVNCRDYCFNPAYLALFTKVTAHCGGVRENKGVTVDLHLTADGQPMLVRVGERFRGLIVPVRKAG